MNARTLTSYMIAFAVCMVAIFAPLPASMNGAFGTADARAEAKTVFDLLFKNKQQKAAPKKAPITRKRVAPVKRATNAKPKVTKKRASVTRKKNVTSTPNKAAAATTEPAVKNENARRVLVVGDFIADGMSEGLQAAFADVANVVVEARANGSSGLVRDDFYNWAAEIGPILEDVKPDVLVIQLGSNDRQVMRIEGATRQVRDDAWTAEYQNRIDAFLNEIAKANVAVVWVGAPPFKFASMSADILAFNEVYRSAVEQRRGSFVDIWDGFVDENGRFITSGSDIKGQTVRLRASDGINFSRAGKRKMAFYVERQLKLMLGDAASPLLTSLAPDSMPMMRLPPLQTEGELERTNPIAMLDPDFDGGASLLGDMSAEISGEETAANPLQSKSVRQRLIEDGTPPPAQPGRAGNFSWQSEETTSSTAQSKDQLIVLPDSPPQF